MPRCKLLNRSPERRIARYPVTREGSENDESHLLEIAGPWRELMRLPAFPVQDRVTAFLADPVGDAAPVRETSLTTIRRAANGAVSAGVWMVLGTTALTMTWAMHQRIETAQLVYAESHGIPLPDPGAPLDAEPR